MDTQEPARQNHSRPNGTGKLAGCLKADSRRQKPMASAEGSLTGL